VNSLTRPLLAFDIETIPDPEIGERLFGFTGTASEVAEALLRYRSEETSGKTTMLKPPYHRIVMISLAWLDPLKPQFKLNSLEHEPQDEAGLITQFFRTLSHPRPFTLISWNGKGFDLPVIFHRAMLHWIPLPHGYGRDPFSRYGEDHLDLMDILAGYGMVDRLRLDEWARILGLPGKSVTQGDKIYEHAQRGEWELIRTYCELDALTVLLLYLRFAYSRGILGGGEIEGVIPLIADDLKKRTPPYQEFARSLEKWQESFLKSVTAKESS
jgi:predicted PolB exonuclease-like 3'-5' exonuclease